MPQIVYALLLAGIFVWEIVIAKKFTPTAALAAVLFINLFI